ncbi:MAG: hypothetical protein JST68_01195 [Bacteroidetes bacterium]|nr:hypothetical protein [Bacteroidota bacterium]
MKKIPILLFVLSLLNCKGPGTKDGSSNGGTTQKFELIVDGNKKNADPGSIISCGYTGAHLVTGYLSEKEDVQLSLSSYMQDLKPGTYQVYDCKSASECNETMPDNNQVAQYGPYPKDPMPALSLFRTAFNAPKLGLKPLTLTITSITDEQMEGSPLMTKRVEGQFSGSMAHVEQEKGGYEWHVVAKTQVEGSFSVFCSIR